MGKKPKLSVPSSLPSVIFDRLWGSPLRKLVSLVCATLAGFAGAVLSISAAYPKVEPFIPALRYDVREIATALSSPAMKLAQEHSTTLDYLILKDQRQALKDAKEDLARDPRSSSAAQAIDALQRSIDVRQKRLDEATKNRPR